MFDVLLFLTLLIALGVAWRWIKPGGQDVDVVRRAITGLVFNLLLPVLIIKVMWQTHLDLDSLRISILGTFSIFAGFALMRILVGIRPVKPEVAGALILASGLPNATYLGLPLLDASFGSWTNGIAIQYELFACTPVLVTVGALVARHYGSLAHPDDPSIKDEHIWESLLKIPPLWAMLIAIVLTISGISPPAELLSIMEKISAAVVPLMLLAIGMGLEWRVLLNEHRSWLSVVVILQLLINPLLVWLLAPLVGLQGDVFAPTIMIAATPCMVAGILICDRYRIKSSLYAAAVTLTTLVSLITLPLWLYFLTSA